MWGLAHPPNVPEVKPTNKQSVFLLLKIRRWERDQGIYIAINERQNG